MDCQLTLSMDTLTGGVADGLPAQFREACALSGHPLPWSAEVENHSYKDGNGSPIEDGIHRVCAFYCHPVEWSGGDYQLAASRYAQLRCHLLNLWVEEDIVSVWEAPGSRLAFRLAQFLHPYVRMSGSDEASKVQGVVADWRHAVSCVRPLLVLSRKRYLEPLCRENCSLHPPLSMDGPRDGMPWSMFLAEDSCLVHLFTEKKSWRSWLTRMAASMLHELGVPGERLLSHHRHCLSYFRVSNMRYLRQAADSCLGLKDFWGDQTPGLQACVTALIRGSARTTSLLSLGL